MFNINRSFSYYSDLLFVRFWKTVLDEEQHNHIGGFRSLLSFALCLSLHFHVIVLYDLCAAKNYSIALLLGMAFGMLILGKKPTLQFYFALAFMIISTYFMIIDSIKLQYTHEHTHTHTYISFNGEDSINDE